MAYFPCDQGMHYNPRRNYLCYVGCGRGTEMTRWRLRFCLGHIRAVQEYLAEFEVDPENGTLRGGDAVVSKCLSCRQPVDQTGRQLFVTCYPPEDERKDYWSHIHVDCSLPVEIEDRWSSKSA